MGNHDAGHAMGIAAEALLKVKKKWTQKEALKALDSICKEWSECDAEFEASDPKKPGHIHPEYTFYTDPKGPLGKLIIIAFGDGKTDYVKQFEEDLKNQADPPRWSDDRGPEDRFTKRYKFC